MFVERTEKARTALEHENDRIFVNNCFAEGNSQNAQFLRYKANSNTWELDVRVEFTKFVVVLQEWQAKLLIDGNTLGHKFTLSVVNCEKVF